MISIAKITWNNCNKKISGFGKNGKDKSITIDISIAFRIVAIPGFCFNGNQNSREITLTINVVIPIV